MGIKKNIIYFLLAYFSIRLFSYFFGPATPLQTQSWVNTAFSLIILSTAIFWLIKKDIRGWYIVAGEVILGGAGGFLSVGPLSLRTSLLIVSMAIFDIHKLREGKYLQKLKETLPVTISLALLFTFVGISAIHGYLAGHGLQADFSDTIPYLFFLYFYPLRELVQSEKFKSFTWDAFTAAIIGNAIFISITIFNFSANIFQMQGGYYHWFRDVALGKITEIGFNFYRVVLNEHLLLIPILLYVLYILINKKIKKTSAFILIICLLFILSLNLTRIYMLGLAVGILFLFKKTNWKRWLIYSTGTALTFIIIFTSTHLIASRGQSLGWEIFGLRLQSIVQPQIEDSSLSRMLLLPKIWEKIKLHPLLGEGLGNTVTVYSPVLKQEITTPHFDWGYLEIWTEMGLFGLIAWVIFIYFTYKKAKEKNLLPLLCALLVINITSPALFHVMGILLLVWLLVDEKNINDKILINNI